jgi:cellulose synthase/poly-beta-1,6-N-acetylglucosamine synthase-like glycosyltransferase
LARPPGAVVDGRVIVLLKFDPYDLFVLSFVQLGLSTVLVLSPAREIGIRLRKGSRITEVLAGSVGAVAISALACLLTKLLWGLPLSGLETAAWPLVVASIVVIALQPDRNLVGQVFYASFGSASVAYIVWAAYIVVVATTSVLESLTASFVLLLDLAAFVVWMSNVNYQTDVLTRSRRRRPLPKADPSYQPMVSLHIPAHNEPPELLIETIKAAERIDYPDFEIVVMDNNTDDPAVWGPVEEYCRDRPRVKFVHVADWPGYKAGACNLALRSYTDPRAEIIGLVDADDLVQPYYLRETVAYFSDPSLGFLQTFEGNRDFEGSPYYTACVDSFQAFYLSVMSSRNERRSIPFVGTMGLFRRSALTAIGGWNEWCICEDTEASLRVLKDGWSGLYVPRCFGRGIVPPSFAGMLTQRHRWCFGAMQILRLHWRSLMPWDRSPNNQLTPAQRRDYLMASVGWFRDLLMLAFSLLLLAIAGLVATHSGFAVAPLDGSRSLLPLSLIVIATTFMMFTQRHWTTLSLRRAVLSLVVSLAVTFVIARGCIEGLARRDGVFLRTSKADGRRTILTALKLTRWETAMAVALYASVGFLAVVRHRPWLLMFLIFAQATVYLCAPLVAVWNPRAKAAPAHRRGLAGRPEPAPRRRRAALPRPAAAALTALFIGGLASLFVAPVSLLEATSEARGALSPGSLLAISGAHVYLKVGSSGGAYYPVTSVNLSDLAASSPGGWQPLGLSFETSSLVLLDDVLRAAARGGSISNVGLAFRISGRGGRQVTERMDAFATAEVTSMSEQLSGKPTGTVSLLLPAAGDLTSPSDALQHAGPFLPASAVPTARAYVALGAGPSAYPVSAVSLSQAGVGAPFDLTFTTSAPPLLGKIFTAEGAATTIHSLTLTVRGGAGGGPLLHTFSRLTVSGFAENVSGPLAGTATLAGAR